MAQTPQPPLFFKLPVFSQASHRIPAPVIDRSWKRKADVTVNAEGHAGGLQFIAGFRRGAEAVNQQRLVQPIGVKAVVPQNLKPHGEILVHAVGFHGITANQVAPDHDGGAGDDVLL